MPAIFQWTSSMRDIDFDEDRSKKELIVEVGHCFFVSMHGIKKYYREQRGRVQEEVKELMNSLPCWSVQQLRHKRQVITSTTVMKNQTKCTSTSYNIRESNSVQFFGLTPVYIACEFYGARLWPCNYIRGRMYEWKTSIRSSKQLQHKIIAAV